MTSQEIRRLIRGISSGVLFVDVRDRNDRPDIGTAFHIGAGYCATAKHVVDTNRIVKVGRLDTSILTQTGSDGHHHRTTIHGSSEHPVEAIYRHPDQNVDVAVIKLGGPAARRFQPFLPLSNQANLLSEGEYLMEEVIVLGYPPIPWADDSHLFTFRGEVSAVIENRNDRKRHFVISGMARGGFSGGPVVLLGDSKVLGVVVASLTTDDASLELGFIGAINVDTVLETIDAHHLTIPEVERFRQRQH